MDKKSLRTQVEWMHKAYNCVFFFFFIALHKFQYEQVWSIRAKSTCILAWLCSFGGADTLILSEVRQTTKDKLMVKYKQFPNFISSLLINYSHFLWNI